MSSRTPGLFQRGAKYWLRIVAPKDLAAAFYGGKKFAFEGTLGTSDPAVAKVAAAAKRAEMEAAFLQQRRQLAPPKLSSVGPELRACIVDTLLAQEVARDAAQRLDKTGSTRVHADVSVAYANDDGTLPERPPVMPVSVLKPLDSKTVANRALFNKRRQEVVRAALAAGNLEVMLPLVKPITDRLGLAVDYETADGVQLLQDALAAYMRSRDVAVERDEGKVVPTPAMPSCEALVASATAEPEKQEHLSDIMADWLAIKTRTRPATKITQRALNLMAEAGVDVPLQELNRQHGATLRAHLFAKKIKGQSVKNLIAPLQALLNVAVDAGKLKANPWAGLKIDTSDSTQRLPWRLEDLKLLAAANAKQTDVGRWLFPLGLYTAARIGELAQSELSDIQQVDGVPCIEIHERESEGHEKRSVKSKAGTRLIPVSQHLIDLGFLDHVAARRAAGDRFLFPAFIQKGKRLPSELAGAYFRRLREDAGVVIDDRWTFHSLRHNGRSTLAAAGVNDQIIDKLVGHESGTVQGRYTHATTATLAAAVAKIDWSTLGTLISSESGTSEAAASETSAITSDAE